MRRTLLLFMLLAMTGAAACGEAVTLTPPSAYPAPEEAAVATPPPPWELKLRATLDSPPRLRDRNDGSE